jgi:hypothetical protein
MLLSFLRFARPAAAALADVAAIRYHHHPTTAIVAGQQEEVVFECLFQPPPPRPEVPYVPVDFEYGKHRGPPLAHHLLDPPPFLGSAVGTAHMP